MEPAKRRILFLITTSDWGGAQLFVHAAALAAKAAGHSVMVAAGGTGELQARCEQDNLWFRRLETVQRELSPFRDLAAIHEIRRLIREFKPDAIHLNSSKMGVIGSLAASQERIPLVIYRIGGWAFLEDVGTVKRFIYLWSEKLTAKKKDIIVTVHPGDEAVAKKEGITPRKKILTIANGIETASFDAKLKHRDESRQELGLSSEEFVIGAIANFYPPKNLPWFFKTVGTLLKEKNLRLVVLGDGPERPLVEKTIHELHLGNNILLTGRRDNASSLLSAFDIFVLPSSKEGMPWSLLEAMAARLPCIATDVGACRWMLEPDAGIIVPAKNEDAMRAAILSLVDDKQKRAALGEATRSVVETRFRWEDTIKRTLELFS